MAKKEAMLYQKVEDNKAQCNLCAHRCSIPPEKKGVCGVRVNKEGTLYTKTYGKVITANADPIEKKPLFHFLPGTSSYSIATAGCNFRCKFCQNWRISQLSKKWKGEFPGEKMSPEPIVKEAKGLNCASIAYTYTEPTIFFEYAYDTAKLAQKEGLKNVFVTNGYQTPETIEKMVGIIDAANIDLKSFRNKYYQEICGAKLQPVLDSIQLMRQKGIWIEVTTLVVPDQNDSNQELTEIAEFIASIDKNIPWHISRFHPQYQITDSKPTPMKTLEKAAQIGKVAGLRFIYLGNIYRHDLENTYCPQCKELLISRQGFSSQSHLQNSSCPNCNTKIPGIFK